MISNPKASIPTILTRNHTSGIPIGQICLSRFRGFRLRLHGGGGGDLAAKLVRSEQLDPYMDLLRNRRRKVNQSAHSKTR